MLVLCFSRPSWCPFLRALTGEFSATFWVKAWQPSVVPNTAVGRHAVQRRVGQCTTLDPGAHGTQGHIYTFATTFCRTPAPTSSYPPPSSLSVLTHAGTSAPNREACVAALEDLAASFLVTDDGQQRNLLADSEGQGAVQEVVGTVQVLEKVCGKALVARVHRVLRMLGGGVH